MQAARVGDYRHAASVQLDEDEFLPYRGYVWLRGRRLAWIMGGLFLTTKRLIWLRTGLPLGPKVVEVPLSDIEGWSLERVPWWWRSRRWGIVRIRKASETHDFMNVWAREDADEWAEAFETVMEDAGLASRGARK